MGFFFRCVKKMQAWCESGTSQGFAGVANEKRCGLKCGSLLILRIYKLEKERKKEKERLGGGAGLYFPLALPSGVKIITVVYILLRTICRIH